jgi:hypothetical protein
MKNLIKTFLFLLFVLISFPSFSQFKAGVKAGLNIADVIMDDWETVPHLLYSGGLCFDISFGDMVSLQPALLLSGKGFSLDIEDLYGKDYKGYSRTTVNYLEVPINVAFKFKGFQVYTGLYMAYGLSGKNKHKLEYEGETESGDDPVKLVGSSWNSDESDAEFAMRRFDFGWNLGAGYKLGPVLFSAGLSLGLANLTPDDTANDDFDPGEHKITNIVGMISVTYFFGKWKE